MKEKIIKILESQFSVVEYEDPDTGFTESTTIDVLTTDEFPDIVDKLEILVNQEVEKRIAETVAGKFIAVEIEKRIADRFPSKEEILKYFNNHFNCYTDVTIRDYETTEIAMTNIAVLKMFEWLRSRLVSQKTDNLKENNNNGSTN